MPETYLVPALLAVLVALVGSIGTFAVFLLRRVVGLVETIIHRHLHRHPEDLEYFRIGGSG